MPYRTYDSAWNRTGYASEPQYPGQTELTKDYPATCQCGAGMLGCGEAEWLHFRGWSAPDWVRQGYVAWCHKGHEMLEAAL
jgi:hypothetical protein